jgi:protoheme IX farnesyltransferase
VLNTIKIYYQLTKPGIVYGNMLNATAGLMLASSLAGQLEVWRGLATLLGVAFVIAASCVCNNFIDRGIDKIMARTKKRALVSGAVSVRNALLYSAALGVAGFVLLIAYTNSLTVWLGVTAVFMYIVVYGLAKRYTMFSTLIGGVSGALPPVAGYTAVANQLDAGALLIFLILTFWQIPHFYAVAIFREKEYAAAGIPLWTIKRGVLSTKVQMVAFLLAFAVANVLLTVYDYTGYTYLIVVSLVSILWLGRAARGFHTEDNIGWARGVFFFSLIVILVWAIMMSLGALLP